MTKNPVCQTCWNWWPNVYPILLGDGRTYSTCGLTGGTTSKDDTCEHYWEVDRSGRDTRIIDEESEK